MASKRTRSFLLHDNFPSYRHVADRLPRLTGKMGGKKETIPIWIFVGTNLKP